MLRTLDESSYVRERTGRCSIICLARCARRILPVRERKGERELLHLHLAMHRRSVKAPVHGSITCQRGMDNVAAWWSVTSTEAYSEILEYTRFYRLKISARRFSFNFSFNIFFFFGSIDQPNTTARYCRLLSFVSLINNRIVETVFRILKLYSKICANNYYFENIVFFFFFSFAFLLGKSKL